mmetsp:Transcript_52185/g.161974  ORF Transcript_52185/g.161974 Transcript_52185/m.161974 type:complete len:223 (-) Transcript_52185:1330-1998(-)
MRTSMPPCLSILQSETRKSCPLPTHGLPTVMRYLAKPSSFSWASLVLSDIRSGPPGLPASSLVCCACSTTCWSSMNLATRAVCAPLVACRSVTSPRTKESMSLLWSSSSAKTKTGTSLDFATASSAISLSWASRWASRKNFALSIVGGAGRIGAPLFLSLHVARKSGTLSQQATQRASSPPSSLFKLPCSTAEPSEAEKPTKFRTFCRYLATERQRFGVGSV